MIMDEKPDRLVSSLQVPGQISSLLCEPGQIWVVCATGNPNASRADLNEEQEVDRLQKQRLNSEEITGDNLLFVVVEECSPGSWTFRPWVRGSESFTLLTLGPKARVHQARPCLRSVGLFRLHSLRAGPRATHAGS